MTPLPPPGEARRILAVGAHPDDVEILCAGTLARAAAEGHHVTICVATNGNLGSMRIQPEDLGAVREEEARRSAALIGADFLWLNFPDEYIYHDHATRMRFIEMIRQARPDVIITHAPNDYHMDHRVVADLVLVSSFIAAVPNARTDSPRHPKIPPIFHMDTLAGVDFQPTDYVDISDYLETKREMMRQHASQLEWLGEYNGIDIDEFIVTVARFRGLQCGAKYAEGFRRFQGWPRVTPERILP